MACHSGNLRTSSRQRSIWTVKCRLKNVFQLLNDTVRHLVFNMREHEDVVVRVELLSGEGFERAHSDSRQTTVSSCTCGD